MTLAKFLVVGGSGVLVNTLALFILHQVAGLSVLFAVPIAVEIAIVSNFVWNDRWTFGCPHVSWKRFARFNLVSLLGLLVTTLSAWALIHETGWNYLVANLAGIALATGVNFVANLEWTWRGTQSPPTLRRL